MIEFGKKKHRRSKPVIKNNVVVLKNGKIFMIKRDSKGRKYIIKGKSQRRTYLHSLKGLKKCINRRYSRSSICY